MNSKTFCDVFIIVKIGRKKVLQNEKKSLVTEFFVFVLKNIIKNKFLFFVYFFKIPIKMHAKVS